MWNELTRDERMLAADAAKHLRPSYFEWLIAVAGHDEVSVADWLAVIVIVSKASTVDDIVEAIVAELRRSRPMIR